MKSDLRKLPAPVVSRAGGLDVCAAFAVAVTALLPGKAARGQTCGRRRRILSPLNARVWNCSSARCSRETGATLADAWDQGIAAPFNFDNARIFTRTLAGLAAPFIISPVAGLRTSVPALRAGTLRSVILQRPGKVNSPTPRGCTEPSITDSSEFKTPIAVLRGMSFSSASRLMSADFVRVSLITGIDVSVLPGFFLAIIFSRG